MMGRQPGALILAVILSGRGAIAQTGAANGPGTPVMMSGKSLGISGFAMYTLGEPFQLVERRSRMRTPLDTTQGTDGTLDHVFRDGQGRFRLESGRMRDGVFEIRMVTIVDPVALVSISFSPHGTTGRLTHIAPRQLPTAEDEQKAAAQKARSDAYDRAHPDEFSDDMLGRRLVAGEAADGRRLKQTFVSVDRAERTVIVTETWMSPDLKIALLTVTDNDKTGVTKTEVTELKRVEPDAALFKAPAGLTLEEQLRR